MAALTPNQCVVQWQNGVSDKTALYALRGINTGDTVQLVEFSVVKQAIMLGTTVNGSATASITQPNSVTMPAGLNNDAAFLLAWGASA